MQKVSPQFFTLNFDVESFASIFLSKFRCKKFCFNFPELSFDAKSFASIVLDQNLDAESFSSIFK
jgi:hypothetical protein